MKTKNILLPAIALLAGTLLSAPANAQFKDYHDAIDSIKQDIKIEIPAQVIQKSYLNVGLLFNQMNEDLPIDTAKLSEQAKNSITDGKISDTDQYDLMVLAIQTNHNEVLETLLKAGFKADTNSLIEIAQAFKNNEALDLINTYMVEGISKSAYKSLKKITPIKKPDLKKLKKQYGETKRIEKLPAAVLMVGSMPIQNGILIPIPPVSFDTTKKELNNK